MVGVFQTTMYFLSTFVLPVDLIDPVMVLVNVCPRSKHDVMQASKRLRCGDDIYGNNQYLCLPNKNKTSLVEICFQGVMGIVEKGNCLEFSEGKLIKHRCNLFRNGCPETHYYDNEIYKYPACQKINREFQCYVMDRNCSALLNTKEHSDQNNVILNVGIGFVVVLIILVIIITVLCYKQKRTEMNKILRCKKRRAKRNKGNKDENNFDIVQEILLSGTRFRKDNETRMVLIGKTGTGKSATGNTILGKTHFKSCAAGSSVTSKLSIISAVRFNQKVFIVDTPGIFDTKNSKKDIQKEILKCISVSSPGPHAFILVLTFGRHTEEQEKAVQHFVDFFGVNVFQYSIVLFTRKDDLDNEEENLDDFIKSVPSTLKTFIEKCGRRVIAFNNKLKGDENDEQVKELLSMISNIVEKNNGDYYKNEMYEEAEKRLQKREAKLRKKTQIERDKQIKAIEKTLKEKFEKEAEKHKRKSEEEFRKWRDEYIKQQREERKAKEEQLKKEYDEQLKKVRDVVRKEVLEED